MGEDLDGRIGVVLGRIEQLGIAEKTIVVFFSDHGDLAGEHGFLRKGLELCESAYEALKGADALAIVTEWQEFRSPDFHAIKEKLGDGVIVDGRNLYEPDTVEMLGLQYYAIGRGRV